MESVYSDILNPVAIVSAQAKAGVTKQHRSGGRRVVALLDNSKPNVAYFLEAVQEELRRSGDYEILKVTKPRSAAPCLDLAGLAQRCDFAINAVAD